MPGASTVHIAGRGSVVRQLRILVLKFRVLRKGTLFEIRLDNMYQPLCFMQKRTRQINYVFTKQIWKIYFLPKKIFENIDSSIINFHTIKKRTD